MGSIWVLQEKEKEKEKERWDGAKEGEEERSFQRAVEFFRKERKKIVELIIKYYWKCIK